VKAARFSSLDTRKLCGKAHTLDIGAGRAAAMSTAFHAMGAASSGDAPHVEAARLAKGRLTDAELEEVESWPAIEALKLGPLQLDYADALKEFPVGLTAAAQYCNKGDPAAMVEGTADMVWVVRQDGTVVVGDVVEGADLVVVGDMKKSRFTSRPDSLQLHGYGMAAAKKFRAGRYRLAIWIIEEGRWWVGPEVDLFEMEAAEIWEQLRFAATNDSDEFAMGPHCHGCYNSHRCPAYMAPIADTELVVPSAGKELDHAGALRLLLLAQRAQKQADALVGSQGYLKLWARERGGIPDGKGKIWKPTPTKGRESTSVKKVREIFGDEAEKAITVSGGGESWRWVKDHNIGRRR